MDYSVEAPLSRHVMVHFHMFKNGGSTIESILDREFGGRFATFHGSQATSALDGQDVAAFLAQHPNLAAVSSHHLRYPLPNIRGTVLFDCCFLRHPLDRLQSVYTFLRAKGPSTEDPTCLLARSAGPREFMTRLMEELPHMAGNAQTLLLANGGAFTRPMDETDLAHAKEVLRQMALPGLLTLFDESLAAAEHFLAPAFPNLRLHYVPQNVTRPNFERRMDELRALWGSDIYQELLRLNRLDLELCAYAETEIQRRFSLVPNAKKKMLDFRTRCFSLDHHLMASAAAG